MTSSPDDDEVALSDNDFQIFQVVREYLDSSGFTYTVAPSSGSDGDDDDSTKLLVLTLTGNNAAYKTYINLKKREHRVAVYVESPIRIPPHKRPEVCEFLMRVNYSVVLGNFEIDFTDGEVRFRLAIDVEGSALSTAMIRSNIMVSASTVDRFFPGLMAVAFANKLPEAVYDEITTVVAGTTMQDAVVTAQ